MTYFNTTIMFVWIVDLTFWFPTKSLITKNSKIFGRNINIYIYLRKSLDLFRYPLSNLTFRLCPHKSSRTGPTVPDIGQLYCYKNLKNTMKYHGGGYRCPLNCFMLIETTSKVTMAIFRIVSSKQCDIPLSWKITKF